MARIRWTELALDELKDIFDFIALDSRIFAYRQVRKIKERTNQLRANIYFGKILEEVNIITIREIIQGNYRIIYKIENKNEIVILSIHHGARNLGDRIEDIVK